MKSAIQFQVKLLTSTSKAPVRGNPTDAGLDLFSNEADEVVIKPGHRKMIGTGFSMAIPDGYVALIWPRSGAAWKQGSSPMAGVIDSAYRGEVKVIINNTDPETDIVIKPGERFAQMLIQEVELWNPVVVEELDETVRGEGGFGSTGTN